MKPELVTRLNEIGVRISELLEEARGMAISVKPNIDRMSISTYGVWHLSDSGISTYGSSDRSLGIAVAEFPDADLENQKRIKALRSEIADKIAQLEALDATTTT